MKSLKLVSRLFVVLLLLFSFQCFSISFPNLNGRFYDGANILNEKTKADIDRISKNLEQKSTIQFVVATFSSLQGQTIENFGYQLGRHWGIGQKKLNNGVILIIAPQERMVRIEVGYGLEGILTDAICATIINQVILPSFKANNFEQATFHGAEEIAKALGQDKDKAMLASPSPTEGNKYIIAVIILTLCISAVSKLILNKYQRILKKKSRRTNNYLLKFIILLLLVILYIISIPIRVVSNVTLGSGSGGNGGFSGGGGSFGGGGASGRG